MPSWAETQMFRMGLRRCPGCPGDRPVIPSDIPSPFNSGILFVGDKPGREEDSKGKPFIGQTGKELNEHYLPLAGFTRSDVGFCNTSRCYHELNSDSQKARDIQASCSYFHLRQEILEHKPKVIVPMGAVACSLVEGLNLEMQHGIPFQNEWFGHPCTTFPMWHPAAGLHSTSLITDLRQDFTDLGAYIRGQLTFPVDEYEGCEDYRLLTGGKQVKQILSKYNIYDPCNADTEYDNLGLFCISFSLEPGTGYVILEEDKDGIGAFGNWLTTYSKGPVVFHNAMADIERFEEANIHVPMHRLDDTMVRAYHLQNLPQGLKTLAYRLCGARMVEYEDVVLPYAVDRMVEYVLKLSCVDWLKPSEQLLLTKEGTYKLYKPQGLNTKLKRLITDFSKKPSHKIFDRWYEWSDDEKLPAIQQFGLMPEPSVRQVPLDRLITYSARDADVTGRVRTKLIELKRQMRHAA